MTVTSSTIINTKYGDFVVRYHQFHKSFCVSLVMGNVRTPGLLVRIQSSCIFSESFHSVDCDCNIQLSMAMKIISKEGNGLVIYTYEEGRGIGLENKIKAMELERVNGIDTVEAFKKLHFSTDLRTHENATRVLRELGVKKDIRLITCNPHKIKVIKEAGIDVTRYDLKYKITERIKKYLRVKKEKLGYFISDDMVK